MNETNPNTATIFVRRGAYYIDFDGGPQRDAVLAQSGTTIFPLRHPLDTDISVVLAEMREMMPDIAIRADADE